ncbi:MAG TPA: amino acid adenylation domain-containing protein [Pyrinomonadaceae bacterium]|nr:amino acid adenylation domain-containing protein [Pyrinomonadaceae bacterium]
MSNITKRIADLSPDRRRLLERLMKRERVDVARAVMMPRRDDGGPPPLSFAQQRLWFLQQLEPESPAYNLPSVLRLTDALDTDALGRSLGELVRRHETLRTTFDIVGGQPRQLIADARPVRLPIVDLTRLPPGEREAAAQRLVEEEIRRPFDLARGPLLRASLLRLGEREHTLLLVMHHIVSDGWSMGVLVRELSTLYAAFKQGTQPELPELPVQYADYAVWQREYLTGEVLEEQLRYWREQLGGELPVLELPADRPRPAVRSYRGAEVPLGVDERVTEGLRALAREGGATLFMVLLAAFDVLLYRYTGRTDVVVGTPVAGRTRAEVEHLIGFFVNTLALRTKLDGRVSFRELLRRVRETTVGAFAHQELPFERVVEELRPERNTSHAPLFQVMLALQNASSEELELTGVGVEELEVETGAAKLDVRLSALEMPDGLSISIRYSTDLFDAERIRLMLEHYRVLLEGVVAAPDARISDLPLLTAGERRRLLIEWNDTAREYPPEKCLHQLCEEQAARTPEAVAVIFERGELTYAELNARANRLARRLRALGVGADTRVGVMLERSTELVVTLLATLKAGGAYVPLDSSYPRERLAFMLEDAACPVLLTQRRLLDSLPMGRGQVVCVDDPSAFVGFGDEDLAPLATPDSLAYVIYTSGSTGKPKGAMNTHGAICNRLLWMQDEYRLTPDDRVLQKTPFSFDVSVWEFFWPLLAGAALVVARPDGHRDSTYLADLVLERQVTTLHFVPSMLQVFLEEPRVPLCTSLRRVISSGEALPFALQQRFFARSGAELHNLYGPTEAAVDVTAWECRRDAEGTAVPIGRPIANTRTYVLDEHLNPVPAGVAGELHLGGAGLARGYLNRPGLTAERFIPDPFSAEPGARLYKTGDLARHLPAGELEYLGRLDHQVKIRGFRVEPGEIEAVIGEHPSVRECVVTVREEGGDRRLVAYVVGAAGTRPEAGELREHLRGRLPEYMVPAGFVMLDALPLSPNGKVDRGALPAPDAAHAAARREYVAPRTPTEAALAAMWAEILRVERVGVTDNFFELGGDSIKGAVFINRLQERLGEIVHVITIFNGPTVGQLAAYLDEQYGGAVRRLTTDEPTQEAFLATPTAAPPRALRFAQMRELLGRPSRRGARDTSGKNPRAVFVLSPPRSGSTLLRVMLAGHPLLFAPPELELLSFDTLRERRAAFSGANSFWLEGLVRAVMELKGCDAAEAKRVMEDLEARGLTTKECCRLLQEWLGERTLVDKTPSYAFDPSALAKAEEDFDAPLYVHLIRHPFGMIRSFEEARMEQIFFRHEHPFTRRELAELTWLVSHQNIARFLERVPRERQHRVRFEELLDTPEAVLRELCRFLGIEFAAEMCSPYQDRGRRMTDGVHAESRMLGDVKFHRHAGIDASVGARWRGQRGQDDLAAETWEMAAALGYQVEPGEVARASVEGVPAPDGARAQTVDDPARLQPRRASPSPSSTLVMLQPHGRRPPFFCVHPAGANTLCYAELARQLGEGQPFYGLQAPGLDGRDEPLTNFEELAALYVEAVRSIRPRGPYLLGGWSMGGPVAFEMAQQLRRQGQPVALLAVLDSHAPGDAARAIPTDDETLLGMFAGNLGRRHGFELEDLRGRTFDEKLSRLGQLAVETGALPAGPDPRHVERLFRVFKANVRALVEYEPRKYPGRITLFRARQRFTDSPSDPLDGWGALASEGVELHVTPGTHYSMIDMPHAQSLAARLRACVEGALSVDAAEEGAVSSA